MSPEFAALVARYVEGERFNVRAQCALVGCSTTMFYKYAARFAERGVDEPVWGTRLHLARSAAGHTTAPRRLSGRSEAHDPRCAGRRTLAL